MIEQEVVINEVNNNVITYNVVLTPEDDTVVQDIVPTGVVQTTEEMYLVGGFVQGISGPPGQDYTYVNVLAASNIGGHVAVNVLGNPSNNPLLGVSTQSATAGGTLQVQQTGFLEHAGWSWIPEQPIYALDGGTLTQAFPIQGNLVIVGYAVTPTKMFIKQEPAILLG